MNRLTKNPVGDGGFSLIEVMVAVVIICIGLLGIAKLQAMSLSNSTMSRQRAIAAIQAASLASSMHANRNFWSTQTLGLEITIAAPGNVVAIPNPNPGPPGFQTQISTDITSGGPCIGGASAVPACPDPQVLAAFDVARWWSNSIVQLLPNASVDILCPEVQAGVVAPASCTITINWTEKSVAMNGQEAAGEIAGNNPCRNGNASLSECPSLTLYVEP
jgi:type IV pilus assembly protein PilV